MEGGAFTSFDIGRDGRLLYQKVTGEARAFDPRDGRDLTLGNVPANALHLFWSQDGRSVAYLLLPQRKDDPGAGVWVTDFKTTPRQVFHGWASFFTSDWRDDIMVLKGRDDLKGELWTVKWDGSGLSRGSETIPLLYNFNYVRSLRI